MLKLSPNSFLCGCLVTAVFFLYSYSGFYSYSKSIIPQLLTLRSFHAQSNITLDSMFIYKAYYHRVNNETRLRVLTINKCIPKTLRITATLGDFPVVFGILPTDSRCPSGWSPGCKLVSHVLDSVTSIPDDVIKDKVIFPTRASQVKVNIGRAPQLRHGLTVCVPPIYWYTDWTKLILFIEWWKLQGASKFFIYYHSSSRYVKSVFDHYVDEGIVELIPWPKLPSTESSDFDPNKSIYRLELAVAHNDCLMRIDTTYAVNLDIDEMLWTRGTPLLEFAHKTFESDSKLGSLSFPHHIIVYNPLLSPTDFEFDKLDYCGVVAAKYARKSGPQKIIFRTESVHRLSTHTVIAFMPGGWKKRTVDRKKGVLLHNRYTDAKSNTTNLKSVNILPKGMDREKFRKKLVEIKHKIFPDGATFNENTQLALGECISAWRKTQGNCKSPVLGCREQMMGLEDWVETEASENTYTVVNTKLLL